MDVNELIKVETLPKIYQQLEQLSIQIDEEVNAALAMDCTEESKVEVKKARANLNKIKTDLEERRKYVKEQILEPYMAFEKVYNDLIKDKLTHGEQTLKERIDEIENAQKQIKEDELLDYFTEYLDSIHLENVVDFQKLGIKVNLSDSDKKLRDLVKSKLDNIANDIKLVELEENADEIMVEYLKDYDFAKAKLTVVNRINEKNRLEQERLKRQEAEQQDKAIESKVEDEIIMPVEIVDKPVENILTTRFEVKGTKEKLIALKQFMTENEILFWSI